MSERLSVESGSDPVAAVPDGEPIQIGNGGSAELDALVRIHCAAFAGAESKPFGEVYTRRFLQWHIDHPDGIALAAQRDGRPVGFIVGAPRGQLPLLYRGLAVVVLRRLVGSPSILFDPRIRSMLRLRMAAGLGRRFGWRGRSALQPPTMILHTVAVEGGLRSSGVGGRLVEAFETEARRRGARSMCLTLLPDNQAAREMYGRAGWGQDGTDGRRLVYSKSL